ncbi:MAG: MFS transporter [Firmicutes bacterium]|nr:MFS transporter [Bacillota bacterium]
MMQDLPSGRKLLTASGIGMLFDSMDVGLLSFVIAALFLAWKITPQQAGLLSSITLAGMAIGSACAGMLADRIGRKRTFMITIIIFSIASGFSALAGSIGVLLALRFFTGLGLGGELPVATAFVLESSPPEIRGKRTVYLETFWAVGGIVAALIGYLVIPALTWRAAFAITILPALYALYLRRALPESRSFTSIQKRLGTRENFLRLWSSELRRRTIVLWVIYFTANFAYYGMFLWLPSVMVLKGFSLIHSFGYVLIMALAQIPGYLTAATLVEKWGRKNTLIVFTIVSAFSALLFGMSTALAPLLIFGLILNFSNLGAWGATYLFSAEQYPSISRGTGVGFSMGVGKIGGILAPYTVGVLIASHTSFTTIFSLFFVITIIGLIVLIAMGKDVRTD